MRNLITAAAVCGLVILALLWRGQREALQGQERQIENLSAQLESNSATVDLELQSKCARQAGEEFKLEGLDHEHFASYSNHFNKQLGKCFGATQNSSFTSGIPSTSKNLVDAYEGRVLAVYWWTNPSGKKYWAVSPIGCEVIMPSGEKKTCHSSEEFDELIKVYMEGSTLD